MTTALLTADSGISLPRLAVSPTVSGTPTNRRRLDAGASQSVWSVRWIINAGSDVAARNALKAAACQECGRDFVWPDNSDAAVTTLHLIGIGSATNTSGGVIAHSSTTDADWDSALTKFVFDSPDAVRSYYIQTLNEYAVTGGAIDPRYLVVSVRGASHA